MSTFKLTQARAQALALANQRAALKAQELRNEAVLNAPVRTGRLRQSISVQKIGEGWFRVGSNVIYAPFVEFGVRGRPGTPFMRPALEKVRQK